MSDGSGAIRSTRVDLPHVYQQKGIKPHIDGEVDGLRSSSQGASVLRAPRVATFFARRSAVPVRRVSEGVEQKHTFVCCPEEAPSSTIIRSVRRGVSSPGAPGIGDEQYQQSGGRVGSSPISPDTVVFQISKEVPRVELLARAEFPCKVVAISRNTAPSTLFRMPLFFSEAAGDRALDRHESQRQVHSCQFRADGSQTVNIEIAPLCSTYFAFRLVRCSSQRWHGIGVALLYECAMHPRS
jgi:hypothetical protein